VQSNISVAFILTILASLSTVIGALMNCYQPPEDMAGTPVYLD
jgi:hypothetical protein